MAEQEVQAAINAAGNLLPSDLPAPPIYAKINPADVPVLTLALTSKSLTLPQMEDLAETRLAQKISQLPGVGLVRVGGGQRPAVRVQANLRALASYGLNIDDLRTTINNANVNLPKGNFDGPSRSRPRTPTAPSSSRTGTAPPCGCRTWPTSWTGPKTRNSPRG